MIKRQAGFTLIELVVVIVILGILAVTAAPRFLSLQGDAKKASLQGLKGAIDGAAGIVYGKSAIEGEEAASSASTSTGVTTAFGYPTANTTGIEAAVTGLSTDWNVATSDATSITYGLKVNPQATCGVKYTQALSATSAAISTVDDTSC